MKKKIITIILLVSLSGVFALTPFMGAPPQEVQAGVIGDVADCLKVAAVGALIGAAMIIAAPFMICAASFLGFSPPCPPPTIDIPEIVNTLKENILDPMTRCLARKVFDNTIGTMLMAVQHSGRDGGPAFIRNWRNFSTSAQYRGENVFRSVLANAMQTGAVCGFLQNELTQRFGIRSTDVAPLSGLLNLRVNNLLPFADRVNCPLPRGFNLNAYANNPAANGGWIAFERMLVPGGNPLMISRIADKELSKQRAQTVADAEAEIDDGYGPVRGSGTSSGTPGGNELGAGICNGGAAPGMACVSDTDCGIDVLGSGDPGVCEFKATAESQCWWRSPTGVCLVDANIRTPASYVRGTAETQLQSELDWVANVDEISELVIGMLSQQVLNRFLDLGAESAADPWYGGNEPLPTISIPPLVPGELLPSFTIPFYPTATFPGPGSGPGPGPGPSGTPPPPVPGCLPTTCGSSSNVYTSQLSEAMQWAATQGRGATFSGTCTGMGVLMTNYNDFVDAIKWHLLNVSGLTAEPGRCGAPGDVILIKQSAAFHEEYDFFTSPANCAWTGNPSQNSRCTPAAF